MHYLLFTTTTCPKCPAFKEYVSENADFEGEMIDENSEEFMAKAQELNVTAAPTIIIFEDEDEIFRTSDTSELDSFLSSQS